MTLSPPWMAPGYSLQAHPSALHDTMFQNGFFHVLATGWAISTGAWQQGGYKVLVKQYRKNGRFSEEGFQNFIDLEEM